MSKIKKILLQQKSDNFLIKLTTKSDEGLGAMLEMMRRLKDSINKMDKSIRVFNKSSNSWSAILVFLSGLMLIVAYFQIYLIIFYKP